MVTEEQRRVIGRTERLLEAVRSVTLEEFRTEDAHFERDSRLGRELLYLIANNEWCRRTTEIVDIGQVQAVDTDLVVDVDLGYVDHEAIETGSGAIWLPLLAFPELKPTHRRPGMPEPREPETIQLLDVTDASGARVPKMTQAQVHQRLAAALSEITLNVMANRPGQAETGIGGEVDREQKLLLSAAIRRMLPGAAAVESGSRGRVVPTGIGNARARLDAALSQDLETARRPVTRAPGSERTGEPLAQERMNPAPRPVLGSQVGEILEALIGTVFVVVAVEDVDRPQAFTVHVPSRRLRQFGVGLRRLQPRARVSIDLLAPTTHADRQIKLLLPDGVACLDAERAGDTRTLARIDVILPGPFERLHTLMARLFPEGLPADRPVSWVDSRIAEMALHKLDAALDSLRHYEVASVGDDPAPPTRAGGMEELTSEVEARLRRLRGHLNVVRQAGPVTPSTPPEDHDLAGERSPMSQLHAYWDHASWYPATMRRRLAVNTASPGAVQFRAVAVEDVGKRARPTRAQIDADVAVTDSPVFNVARFAGTMNLVLLVTVWLILFLEHLSPRDNLERDTLATVLTLFAAVQASRVEHPDTSTLRGLLSQASYWVLLLSMLPSLLLAVVIAVIDPAQAALAAGVAAICQALVLLRLQLGPLSGSVRRAPQLTLATVFGPDHARADVLRNGRSRALVAEALRLDREAFAYVVTSATGGGQFANLLERSQRLPSPPSEAGGAISRVVNRVDRLRGADPDRNGGGEERTAETVNLLGVVQSATAGQAMTYLVFRDPPSESWMQSGPAAAQAARAVRRVPLDPDRLAPAEPGEWELDVVVGLPVLPVTIPLADHPLLTLLAATARNNFRVLSVQLPAPAPAGRADGEPRRWLRLRVSVPYMRGDSLRGLGSFLYRVQRMDGTPFYGGTLVTDVDVSPERPDAPPGADRVLTDRDFDVVPDEEAAAEPQRAQWRALAICGHARTGLLHDVLDRIGADRPGFSLAGMTAALVHGQTVMFLLGRDSGPVDHQLALRLPGALRPGDQMNVVVDDWQAARTLDGTPADDRCLLRVAIRTPDRPGVLREMLRHLQDAVAARAPAGVEVGPLDVWFVLLQVSDGRSVRGRLTVRLPGGRQHRKAWSEVNWASVGRDVGRAASMSWAAAHDHGNPDHAPGAQLLGDIVVTVDLLRSTAPMPPHSARPVRLDPGPGTGVPAGA